MEKSEIIYWIVALILICIVIFLIAYFVHNNLLKAVLIMVLAIAFIVAAIYRLLKIDQDIHSRYL